jgi:hypothetical protein
LKSERISARGSGSREQAVIIGLNACVVTVIGETPHVLTVKRGGVEGLPFGSFAPHEHRTLQMGLRDLVREQTQLKLGYVEQLYTFGDRGRHVLEPGEGHRVVSVGYLALTRETEEGASAAGHWRSWYDFFPWEDWRQEKPAMIDVLIKPRLEAWAAAGAGERETRWDRAALCFAFDGLTWDEEQVLERYELMYEAGLVLEARRDKRALPSSAPAAAEQARFGEPMQFDHRRILATGMGRLRSKLKYRPVVFELMEPTFTLLELQRTVEAITGVRLHKQNFRRLVESTGLVERTGRQSNKAGGRPAEQFRFRREVLRERPSPGVKVRAR